MLSLQKKTRFGMVEFNLLPIVGNMATLAILPKRPLVFVLFDMAGVTFAGRFAKFMF